MSIETIGILADDLTGAMDGGLQLAVRGIGVRVLMRAYHDTSFSGAVVLDTESRNISSELASQAVRQSVLFFQAAGIDIWYKKIDSTLRGNLGIELEELLNVSRRHAVLLAPALPHAGRTTMEGRHFLNGVPIDETELATDPKTPVTSSRISDLLERQTSLQVAILSLGDIRRGVEQSANLCRREIESGARIVVCDAVSVEDLRTIAQVAVKMRDEVLPCGSAGLLDLLADEWRSAHRSTQREAAPRRFAQRRHAQRRSAQRPSLVISGSMSEVTKAQIDRAATTGDGVTLIRPDHAKLFSDRQFDDEVARLTQEVSDLLESGLHVIADLAGTDRSETKTAESERIQNAAAILATSVCSNPGHGLASRLVLTGGETAARVLETIGAAGIEIHGEVEPLIPSGTLLGGEAEGLAVVTKAGGFGTEDALAKALKQQAL